MIEQCFLKIVAQEVSCPNFSMHYFTKMLRAFKSLNLKLYILKL